VLGLGILLGNSFFFLTLSNRPIFHQCRIKT
jgi:hypothetical protein